MTSQTVAAVEPLASESHESYAEGESCAATDCVARLHDDRNLTPMCLSSPLLSQDTSNSPAALPLRWPVASISSALKALRAQNEEESALIARLQDEMDDSIHLNTERLVAYLKQRAKRVRERERLTEQVRIAKETVMQAVITHFVTMAARRQQRNIARAWRKWLQVCWPITSPRPHTASLSITHPLPLRVPPPATECVSRRPRWERLHYKGYGDGGALQSQVAQRRLRLVHSVAKVLGQRGNGRLCEYQVEWKGFSSHPPTWELASKLHGVKGFEAALRCFNYAAEAEDKVRRATAREQAACERALGVDTGTAGQDIPLSPRTANGEQLCECRKTTGDLTNISMPCEGLVRCLAQEAYPTSSESQPSVDEAYYCSLPHPSGLAVVGPWRASPGSEHGAIAPVAMSASQCKGLSMAEHRADRNRRARITLRALVVEHKLHMATKEFERLEGLARSVQARGATFA
eukprot:CAMPEP_0119324078 /NCGR_PEP_ID=MMETSP1333-20130426/62303_1 /TAXON_ID=418940 /ORGANISM="Scyphosphaera apsteinii, Strain RCC1455" /LENGTH=462 /DNA_ID=CAMNT_0007331693 /DNA_START=282 /DNA_END=1670 /DNA_ORIENTATION=+